MITQPIKFHGGKHYLASKIVALMPPHIHYVEPYGSDAISKRVDFCQERINVERAREADEVQRRKN